MVEEALVERVAEVVRRKGAADVGLMGGTFDPVHIGHVALADAALSELGLDVMVYIPAGVPSFKRDRRIADAADRMQMVRLALAGRDECFVSGCEIDRDGITYTVDTLEELHAALPAPSRLTLVMGEDAFRTLPQWNRAADIVRLARIAWAARAGSGSPADSVDPVVPGAIIDAVRIERPLPAVSSTEVRLALASGLGADGFLAPAVSDYIRSHALYSKRSEARSMGDGKKKAAKGAPQVLDYGWAGQDNVTYSDDQQKELDRLREAVKGRLTGKRLDHVMRVARTARVMACRYGVDPFLAEAAGILHDWDKKLPSDELWEKARTEGVVGAGADPRIEPLLHAWTAGASLHREFGELPDEVFRAVSLHTVGAPDMTALDMVVYLADAIEPGRDYPEAARLRDLVATTDLETLFALGVRSSIMSVLERGRYLDACSVEAWNAWCSRLAR